jgi:hypothetical protein
MAQRAIFVLLMLSLAGIACNAQFGITEPTAVAQGPAIVFIAPENNSTIAEGAEITFAVSASNTDTGISKVDFQVDDIALGSQTAPTPGQPTFSARQSWTAEGVQGHFITAIVYDKDNKAIGDAKLTLQVVTKPGDSTAEATVGTATPTLAQQPSRAIPTLIQSSNNTATSTQPAEQANTTPATPAPAVTIIIAPNDQVVLTVKTPNLNIRAGDGINFQIIGALTTGDVVAIVGRNAARTWWVIQKDKTRGWVIGSPEYSEISGDTSKVPLVASPPTPVPSAAPTAQTAPTSTGAAGVDLVYDTLPSMNPANPTVNQTFVVTIIIRNAGNTDASASLLLGKFQPGDEVSPVSVPAIKAGEKVTVTMPVTLKTAGNGQTGTLTLDNNREIDEGASGETNNVYTLTYNVNN